MFVARKRSLLRLCAVFLCSMGLVNCAAPNPPGDQWPPVVLDNSFDMALTNPATGKAHRIMVWHPSGAPPKDGWPVLYLLDGNSAFGLVTDMINSRSARPEITGIAPAVVVALGYPTGAAYDHKRRIYDLTPPAETLSLPLRPNNKPWPPTGGADALIAFIQDQVKPAVSDLVPVNPQQETLIGHSLGGLFTLYTLMTAQGAFDTYVAISPSLWFNQGQLLTQARTFDTQRPARLFLAVGGAEEGLTLRERSLPNAEQRLAWKQGNRMIGNLADFAQALEGQAALTVALHHFPDEDHGSVVAPALNRALPFILGQM